MSKYKILIEPDPILRQKCEPIDIVDDELRKLMRGMLETMYKAPGIGLAAISRLSWKKKRDQSRWLVVNLYSA